MKVMKPLNDFLKISPFAIARVLFVLSFGASVFGYSAESQVQGVYKTPEERSLYEDSPGGDSQAPLLNPMNPMGLMHLLRKAKAMDDATPPSDAIDQALQSFESQETNLEASTFSGTKPLD